MRGSAYRSLIAPTYLQPKSAAAVALELNARLNSTIITAEMVNRIWQDEHDESFLLQQLGERPASGFDPKDERVKLCDALMGAAAA